MTDKNELYIEQTDDGRYAVRKPGSERASAIEDTQKEAIQRAEKLNPNAAIHVERVRHTNRGTPDHWRNP